MLFYFFLAEKCSKCGRDAVVPTNVVFEVYGNKYGPIIMKCSECGDQPSDEEIRKHCIKQFKIRKPRRKQNAKNL